MDLRKIFCGAKTKPFKRTSARRVAALTQKRGNPWRAQKLLQRFRVRMILRRFLFKQRNQLPSGRRNGHRALADNFRSRHFFSV
jgi:hypothetical protein